MCISKYQFLLNLSSGDSVFVSSRNFKKRKNTLNGWIVMWKINTENPKKFIPKEPETQKPISFFSGVGDGLKYCHKEIWLWKFALRLCVSWIICFKEIFLMKCDTKNDLKRTLFKMLKLHHQKLFFKNIFKVLVLSQAEFLQ